MSEPSIGPLSTSAPSIVHSEPISSEAPSTEPLACVDPNAGYEGAGGAGAEALVRRFSASEGAGGSLEPPSVPEDGPSCADDALRAIAACGLAVYAGVQTGGIGAVVGGAGCIGALGGYIECLTTDDAAKVEAKQ